MTKKKEEKRNTIQVGYRNTKFRTFYLRLNLVKGYTPTNINEAIHIFIGLTLSQNRGIYIWLTSLKYADKYFTHLSNFKQSIVSKEFTT